MTSARCTGWRRWGFLKFDFLGLSNLTILRHAVDLVRAHRGVEIDLDRIPLDDGKTFELLASGETTGVFQLESGGMRRYIRELQPTSVYDLAAHGRALPAGPDGQHPALHRRKHGREPVTYLHPLLEPYLVRTYGVFVYQEDIMAAAVGLAGFTGPERTCWVYAIRKKKSSVLRSLKSKFVTQAAERGVRPETIDAVFTAFEPFERYGFNKAHATCYGLVAYQTAYLKANYTVEYMTSVLTAFPRQRREGRRRGRRVPPPGDRGPPTGCPCQPPRVHRGGAGRSGSGCWRSRRGAGRDRVDHRRPGGGRRIPFLRRLLQPDLTCDWRTKRVLESLVKVGALSVFGHPGRLLDALDDTLAAARPTSASAPSGQISLFDLAAEPSSLEAPLAEAPEIPTRERLRWEKELLGLYLSDHPLGEVGGAESDTS